MRTKTLLFVLIVILSGQMINAQLLDPEKIVFYLPFEENVNDASSKNANFVLSVGDPITYADGKFGKAAVFNNNALVSSDLGFNFIRDFSVSAWIHHFEQGRAQNWMHQKDVDGQNAGRIILNVLAQDDINTRISNIQSRTNTPIEVNTWYHVAIVNNAQTTERHLYVDGELIVTAQIPSPESNTGEIVIGANKGETGNFAAGMIDDLIITTQLLSLDALASIRTNGVAATLETTSVLEANAQLQLKSFYYNGQLTVEFDSSLQNARYSIYSLLGQLVAHGNLLSGKEIINANLPQGIYVVRVEADGISVSDKFSVR